MRSHTTLKCSKARNFLKTQRSSQREAADRLSDPLPFVSDHYGGVIGNAISYSKHRGGSHAVIRVYDAAGNDRDARAQGDFKEW